MRTIKEKAEEYDRLKALVMKCSIDKYGCIIGIKPSDMFSELAESEDERIRKQLIAVVELYYGETDEQEKKDCLAWLEKKSEQKSAWSVEDSAMLDNIVAWIEGKWGTLGGKVGGKEAYISFLKDLKDRYTWKPSDEQIEALQESIGIVGELTQRGKILKELVEQLNIRIKL